MSDIGDVRGEAHEHKPILPSLEKGALGLIAFFVVSGVLGWLLWRNSDAGNLDRRASVDGQEVFLSSDGRIKPAGDDLSGWFIWTVTAMIGLLMLYSAASYLFKAGKKAATHPRDDAG